MANKNGIYEGGVPGDGEHTPTTNLYPSYDGGDSPSQPQPAPGAGGDGRIGYTNSGAPEMNSSYNAQTGSGVNFVDDPSYTGDMSVDNDPAMTIVNPDKLSNSATGGDKGLDY